MDAEATGPGVPALCSWEHYVQPRPDGAEKLREERPDIVFRVYLAADLEFLTDDLVAAGGEVMVMMSSSSAQPRRAVAVSGVRGVRPLGHHHRCRSRARNSP